MEGVVELTRYLKGSLFNKSKDPCITCNHFKMCRHGFACKAFVSYVRTGRYNSELPRFPTRMMYEKLEKEEI
jgi:hypothetical protein